MKQYIVDAFTDTVFKGNPAAVCILDAWIPEGIMMKIAMENRFPKRLLPYRKEAHTICAGLRQAGKSTSAVMPPLLRPMSYSIFIRRTRRKFALRLWADPSLCAATGISFVWIFLAIPSCLSLSQMPWQMPSVCVQNVPIWDGTLSVSFQMKSRSGTQNQSTASP